MAIRKAAGGRPGGKSKATKPEAKTARAAAKAGTPAAKTTKHAAKAGRPAAKTTKPEAKAAKGSRRNAKSPKPAAKGETRKIESAQRSSRTAGKTGAAAKSVSASGRSMAAKKPSKAAGRSKVSPQAKAVTPAKAGKNIKAPAGGAKQKPGRLDEALRTMVAAAPTPVTEETVAAARPENSGAAFAAASNPLGIYEMHVVFNTRIMDDLTAFFRDKLGFRPAAQADIPATLGPTVGSKMAQSHNGLFQFLTDLQYLRVGIAPGASLGFMDWEFANRKAEQAGSPAPPEPNVAGFYFLCHDVAAVYRLLVDRGMEFDGPPAMRPWGHRMIRTVDPEGRAIIFAEEAHD